MNTYNRIKLLRENNGMTQNEVAEKLFMHRTQYRRYENGESEIPLNIAILFAKLYNVSLDYIAELSEDKKGIKIEEPEAKELLQNWIQLSSNEKKVIKVVINEFLKQKKKV